MSAPRWLVRALERVVPADRQDEVIGDLEELHRRRIGRRGPRAAALITALEGSGLVVAHAARLLFGRVGGRGLPVSWIELRLALRLVRRQPVLTLTSVVALGVGIGIAAGGFSVVRQGLYSDLPFENGDRWVVIESYGESGARARLELERMRLVRSSASAFDYVGVAAGGMVNVAWETGEIERIRSAQVTPGTFAWLPYVPVEGRLLDRADGDPGAAPVALIRESLWERRFSRSPTVLERSIDIGGVSHRIVGVLPDEAGYPSNGEIWTALPEETLGASGEREPVAGTRALAILAEGATLELAEEQLRQLSDGAATPGSGLARLRHEVTPITRTLAGPDVQVATTLMVGTLVALLLVIAANVANLVVARTSRRSAELAVRTALGASRGRLIGQLFTEVLVLGGLASVPGLLLAGGILEFYDRALDELPFWVDLHLETSTVGFVLALALLASGVMGVLPALRATRGGAGESLRSAGRGSTLGVGRLGGAMIATEVALSVALLGAAILFGRGFQAYVTPAFDLPDDRVLTARIAMDVSESALAKGGAATPGDSIQRTARNLRAVLAELPGVAAAGVASHLPRISPYPEPLELEGRTELRSTPLVYLGVGALEVLEVEPMLGRSIEERDLEEGAPAVVVVNRSFAEETYGTLQVLGRRLRLAHGRSDEGPEPWREIVGVVPDIMEVTGAPSGRAGVYLPFRPVRFFSVAVRVDEDPMAHAGRVRRALFDLDPHLNVSEVVRLDQVGAENRVALAAMASAFTAVGAVTLLLALAGVYSIVSLSVTQRTREIGVRVAMGADAGSVLWSVVRRSALLVVGGAVVGAILGIQIAQIRLFVFALPEGGVLLYAGLVGLMSVAGVVACWIPARRALAIHPVEALRQEA